MSSSREFADAIRATRAGPGLYQFEISEHWDVWTPNGGYLASLAYSAVAADSSLPRAVSFHCQFLRPGQYGPCEVEVEYLREGSTTQMVRATLRQQGKAILAASVAMSSDAGDGLNYRYGAAPQVAPPQDLSDMIDLVNDPENWTKYWRNVAIRPCLWPEPFHAIDPQWRAWHRVQDGAGNDPTLTVARLLMASDFGPYNAAMAGSDFPCKWIAPNLDLYVQIHSMRVNSDWVLIDSVSPSAADGLVGGVTRVWSPDGTLLATSGSQLLCRPSPFYERQKAWYESQMA